VKSLTTVGLAVVFAACGFAQQQRSRDFVRAQAVPNTTGGNHIVLPATGVMPAPPNQFSITNTGFAGRLGATVSGRQGTGGEFRRFRNTVAIPYAYPVYVGGYGGYGDYGYGYAPDQQPSVTNVNPPQQSPQVVINQNFVPEHATPVMRDYTDDSSSGIRVYEAPGRQPVDDASAEDNTSYYLIAFKDHSIYSAFAYWVEGDTLHYVTAQRVHNQASLSLVDRELTNQLNRDRNLQVKLPK
jgi:hypothetical protein